MFQEIINTQKATEVTARRCSKKELDRDLHTFAHASEGPDAESESEWRLGGVPHWASQPKCTGELTDQVLFERETPEMLL